MGPWKNAVKMLCMRVWSPGARVGHAWLKVEAIKGMPEEAPGAERGIASGTFGFEVAEVGSGGRPKSSGVNPGIKRVTTFWIRDESFTISVRV